MTDILKVVSNRSAFEADPYGHLFSLGDWSEDQAVAAAEALGLPMTEAHWEVVHFLRGYFRGYGEALNARVLFQAMVERFHHRGGGRYLFQLFPGGPVTQASRIAGLPVPANSANPGFGHQH